jgi:hypothetical protein
MICFLTLIRVTVNGFIYATVPSYISIHPWTLPMVQQSSSYSLPFFRKFHKFSHPLTTEIGSQSLFLFSVVYEWGSHVKYTTLSSLLTEFWSSGSSLDLYSVCPRFRSLPKHRLSWQGFIGFCPVPQGKCWHSVSIKQRPFPSKSFLIHYSPVILSSDTEIFVKFPTNKRCHYWEDKEPNYV